VGGQVLMPLYAGPRHVAGARVVLRRRRRQEPDDDRATDDHDAEHSGS
jgi:hypothetical protein